MMLKVKTKASKFLACLLAVVVAFGVIPVGMVFTAAAAPVDGYTITLTDGTNVIDTLGDVEVTLTNDADSQKTETATTVAGVATFDGFVEEGESYTATIEAITGYDSTWSVQFTCDQQDDPDVVKNADIVLTALDKIVISGFVTDEADKAYANAKVEISGYVTGETTTDADGKYSFDAYKGKEYTIKATANDDKYETATTTVSAPAADYECSVLKFAIKQFTVSTTVGENGTITATETVDYGSSKEITATANTGYRIDSFIVDGTEITDAKGKQSFPYLFSDIKENHSVSVTFIRQTYIITFTVADNGKVTYNDGTEQTVAGGSVAIEKIFEESTDPTNPTKVTVTATPEENYRVSKVVIDEETPQTFDVNDKEFSTELEITKDHTFTVEFTLNKYNVTVTNSANGNATVDKSVVEYDSTAVVTITPDEHYVIDTILVNGVETNDFVINNDETSYNLTINNIGEDIVVEITYSPIPVISMDNVTLNSSETIKVFEDADSITYVYKNDGKAIFTTTKNGIRINGDKSTGKAWYTPTWEIKKSTVVTKIEVFSDLKWAEIELNKKIEIVIDNNAPEIENATTTPSGWTNADSVTITGTAKDEGTTQNPASGISYVVWSQKELNETEVASANRATLNSNGTFSFNSVEGEQNSTYYIYAVDIAGNISAAKEVQVQIDKTIPTVDSVVKEPGSVWTNGDVVITATASDSNATDANLASGINRVVYTTDGTLTESEILALGDSNKATYKDGGYSFTLKDEQQVTYYIYAIDNAGNVSVAETIEVKITRVKPSVDTVVKTPEYVWHNDAVTITGTVSSKADASPVVKVVYTTNNQDFNDATLNADGTYEFTVSGEQNISYSIYAIDEAGNCSYAKTIDLKIDTTKPTVDGFDFEIEHNDPASKVINWLTFGLFCNAKIKVTATVSDGTELDDSQCKEVVFKMYENDRNGAPLIETEPVAVVDGKATATIPIDFKGVVTAIVYDNAGNDSEETLATTKNSKDDDISFIMTEDVASEITFKETTPTESWNNTTESWYNKKDIDLPISISDKTNGDVNSGLYSIKIDMYYNQAAEVIDTAEFNEWLGCDEDADTAILETDINLTLGTKETDIFKYLGDGQYKFVVTVVDNCGNATSKEKVIFIDTTSAKITDISLGGKPSECQGIVEETDYGYYFKEDVDVIVTLDDKVEKVNDVSDVAQVLYYTIDYSDVNNPVTSAEITAEYNAQEHKAIIPIEGEFKGQIYIWSVDNAGNNSRKSYGNDAGYDIAPVKPDGSILEPVGKHEVTSSIEIKATATTSTQNEAYTYTYGGVAQKDAIMSYDDAQLVPLYNSNPVFELVVKDEYSGIKEIKVTVIENGVETVKTLSIANNGDKSGDDSDAWTITKEENSNLIISATRTIEVNGNNNNMVILVELTDRAGNSSYDYYAFGIDKTAPVIDVVYNEDSVADEENKTFYKADREAIITITERNFRAEDVVFAITNTDKVIPEIDLNDADVWTEVKNDEDPDKTTYTAKIKYTADGDYTFDIAYKDNAENVANEVEQHAFTIDKTLPVITVAYDNNDAQNGNYYKADRIATLTIVEHNFDPARVKNIGFATDSATGTPVATIFPTISAWQNVGADTYVATIAYTVDSKYTFDIEFNDMAGNSIVDYTPVEFYVDKTAPTLEISGVADNSANKGTVAPIVTYSDTNFNVDAVTITLTGINNGKVNYSAAYAPITNGQTYTYANFEEIQKVDDIYTLTAKLVDMAGNETEQKITFSANRFGSVYDLTDVKDILGKYLTTEQDIVFTETNVDSLDREDILIKLTKNGTPTDLIEGVDYTVETSGGNGRWSVYKYTIKKALFAGDGRYSISVYSTDAAGNVNENIDETKAAEISFGIDKTTPVIVPIDFESNEQYDVEMKTVSIEIKDNLVLEDVKIYLNGQEIEYTVDGETYTFNIPESNDKQDVKIVVVDAAGNEQVIEVNGFTVSTNFFVRWFNDTPVFIGSMVGMVALALGITIFLVFFKKKKKNEDEE